jgi:non-specific serine/threonine protein kinase
VESWDPAAAGGWRNEPSLNETRGGTSAAEAGGRPCVAGGEEPTGTIASVECLAGGRWTRVATLRTPRHGLAVAGLGDRLHVIAGGPEPGLFVSTAHEAFTIT